MNFPADDNNVDDILVLYALEHDVALVGESWIDYFCSVLKACLVSQSNYSYQITLRDGETLLNKDLISIITPIIRAKTIIMVLSPFYFQNPIYLQELEFIKEEINNLAERLFLVEWTQTPTLQALKYRNNYRLWTIDNDKKAKPCTLGFPHSKIAFKGDTEEENYFWSQIQDLADDLQQIISQENNASCAEFSENKPHQTVFLAEVTDDLYIFRENIKDFLEQQNIRVLPENLYRFDDSDGLETQIKADLEQCDLFIQLFSKVVALRPEGMATPLKQFRLAQEIFTQSQILAWRDFELTPEESIDVSVDKLYEATSSSAFKSNIEDFKQQILKRLKQIQINDELETTNKVTFFVYEVENANHHTVFLAEVTDDLHEIREDIKNFLEQQQINVLPKNQYEYKDSDSLDNAIKEDLEKSDLFVQLFSKVPAYRPEGMATPLKQFNLAQEAFIRSSSLVWRNFEFGHEERIDPSVFQLYTKTIDLASTSDIEAFKKDILTKIESIKQFEEAQKNIFDIKGVSFFVYAYSKDKYISNELVSTLEDIEILCSFSIKNLDLEKKLEDIKNNQFYCSIALLKYSESPITQAKEHSLLLSINKTIPQIEKGTEITPVPFIIICQIEVVVENLSKTLSSYFEPVDFTGMSPHDVIKCILETLDQTFKEMESLR